MRFFAITASLSLAAAAFAEPNAPVGLAYATDPNICYRPQLAATNAYAREMCRLDVYRPVAKHDDGQARDAGFATVVWFHAGGLRSGRRHVPDELKGQGVAVVAVGYRLYPRVKCPAYLEDAAAGAAWTFANIARFGGDPNRIYLAGHSAGGYLVSMLGLDKRWLAAHQIDADRLAGVISFSGHAITHFTIREERGVPGTQPIIDEFAPLYHVRPDAPPLMLITGDREREMLGRYEETAYLARMMKVAGHQRTELYELEGFGHAAMAAPAHRLLLRHIRARR